MKSRKTRIFATLGLVAIGGFSLMAISFVEAQSKDIQLNPENAKQTIPTIHFRSTISNQDKYVELTNVKNLAGNDTRLVRIDTKVYNFVLRKGNSDASGMGSTVLGGNSNNVDGGSYSTIIAGSGNQVNNLSYGTIGGGEGNIIDGSYGTVAGGRSNTAKGYSTVVGGNNNKANGEYAVALGKNTTADGNNSVAMGSGAVVRGANSFLWSDKGATVNANDVFVVDGQRGMVVNTGTAHRFAQMTIAGSLLINEAATNKQVECRGGTKGKGVVKVINRTGDNSAQVCFCSCDGDKRHSLFGAGNCSSVCGATSKPECSTAADNLIKKCDETKSTPQFVYSGKCAVGDVVDGPGAYFVDSNGYVHWTCQTNDGAHKDCSSTVKFTQTGSCSEPSPEPECNGSYVGDCYEFLAGSDRGFNGRVDSTLYANRAAALGHSCAYYCVNGCYKDGDQCKERQDCTPDMVNNYELPYLAHGASTGVSKVVAGQTCTTTASCNDGRRTLGADNCTQNTCTGGQPGNNTIKSTATPSSSRGWTYKAGSSLSQLGACEWACTDNTFQRDGTTMNCKKIPKCTDPQPEGANIRKSTAIPTSDKGWTYKSGYSLSQLGACEWSCEDDYERIGNNMYCTERSNKPCSATTISGYNVPAMSDSQTKSVTEKKEDGDCELSCSAIFSCSNGEVTKVSENCSCNDGCVLDGDTLNNAECGHPVDPITINVSCVVVQERKSSQNGCDGPAWMGTTFAVDNEVPVQLSITENLKYHNIVDSSCNYLVNETRTNEWVVNAGSDDVIAKPGTHTWGWRDVTAFDHQEGYQAYYEVENDYTLEIPSRGITVQYGRAEEIVVDGQTYKIVKKRCEEEFGEIPLPDGACGSASQMPSLEKPAANTLCSGGTATDPAEAIVGEPGSLGWSWKCDDEPCWTYMPTSRVDCESISTSPSAPAVFLAYNNIADGAWVKLHIGVWCNNGEREDIRDTFKYDASDRLGILLLNGAYCNGNGIRSIESVDVVGFGDSNYNGHRLIPGSSCTNDNIPECGTANGTMRDDAPAAYDELCKVGSPTAPYGDGMGDDGWGWQCEKEGQTSASCTARKTPKCGNASGAVLPEFPSDDQACDPGYVFVDDNGQTSGKFKWRCGNGTGQVYCSADAKANVKFVVNYNGGGTIYVKEVDIGERGQSDRTSEYGCVPEGGGEAQLGQGGIIGNSITINCSGKDFMVGKTYYPDLVYGTVQGTWASGHPYGGYSITPSVGENVYTFTVDGYNCVGNPPGGNTIYPSTVPTSSNKSWTYKTGYSLSQLGACEWSCTDDTYERDGTTMNCKKKPKCTDPQPGNNTIKSTATPSSSRGWTYKAGSSLSQLGACEWSCTDDTYERDGTTMNCKKKPKCTDPQPGNNTIKSTATPSSSRGWTYKSGYSLSQLGACEWACTDNTFQRDGTTMNCKKIPKCTDPQPEGANIRKSTAIPTSDKGWTYKSGYSLSQLGACEWSCEDDYERIGNNMYCTEKSNKPCNPKVIDGYGVPAMQNGEIKSVPRTRSSGGCTLSCSATFSCSNGDVTKTSENCSCDNDCTLIPSRGATFDNAQCKSICDLPDNELTREYCYNNESLCKTFNNVEENIVVDPNGYCASDKRGTASDCCGKTWRCVMHSGGEGLEMIECEYQGENFCTTPTGYKCRDGYEFDGCDCVPEEQEEILINITCSTKYDPRQGYNYWSCPQHWWIGTTYTADIPLPFDVHIAQTKYLYGISTRNGCSTCYHHNSNHTANYVIKKGYTESRKMGEEWEGGGDLIGPENHFIESDGYDGQFVNGYSSFVDSIDHWPEITVPDYNMYYTSSTGPNYTIVLHDCENLNNGIVNSMENYCVEPTNPNPGGGGGGSSSGGGGSSQLITLNNTTQRYIRLTNNTEYPFHFTDTSAYETDCIGSTEACDLYLQPGQQDFAITYDYCNVNTSFYAQSCRFLPDGGCGPLYQIPISCSTSIIDLNQSSASTR